MREPKSLLIRQGNGLPDIEVRNTTEKIDFLSFVPEYHVVCSLTPENANTIGKFIVEQSELIMKELFQDKDKQSSIKQIY